MKFHLRDIPIKEVLEQQANYNADPYNTEWTYVVLGEKYGSQKLVYKKMEQLAAQDYLEYGVSLRTAWLTDKAKEYLKQSNV